MLAQIDPKTERRATMGGQTKSGPGSATNTVIPGPDHCEGVAMDSLTYPFSEGEAHRRNQLALSILAHRDSTPDTIAAAIAALRGESLPSLVLRGA